jgi:hypothetical protein
VYEQVMTRGQQPHQLAIGAGSDAVDYLPMYDGKKEIRAELSNWKNLKSGKQPPWRLYYPELTIEVVGSKVCCSSCANNKH